MWSQEGLAARVRVPTRTRQRCRQFGYGMLSYTNSPHANKFPTARFKIVRVGAGPRDLLCDRTAVKQALKGL